MVAGSQMWGPEKQLEENGGSGRGSLKVARNKYGRAKGVEKDGERQW